MMAWEIHPASIHFPIAFLLGGVTLDLVAWWRSRADWARVATGLLIAGVATGVLAAAAGLLAFLTVPAHTEAAHGQMYWHLGLASAALLLFAGAVAVRWRRGTGVAARVVGLLAAVILSAAAYLGGIIVYHGGAGIEPALLAPEIRGGHSHAGAGDSGGPHRQGEAEHAHEAHEEPEGAHDHD